jgi:hypothetical protein
VIYLCQKKEKKRKVLPCRHFGGLCLLAVGL